MGVKIDGLDKLLLRFKAEKTLAKDSVVIVGYTAKYALYVHENVEMKWKGKPRKKPAKGKYWEPGQAKFLEQPARERITEIKAAIVGVYRKTHSLPLGLKAGGLLLQRFSQKLVPVDTSALKGSAYTKFGK